MDRRAALLTIAGATMLLGLGSGGAGAGYCQGTVYGLSGRYDLTKGTGFLAVRARPSSSSRMVGQLFNGDTVEIFDRRGNWYRVAMGGIDGWAHARWMRNSCRY